MRARRLVAVAAVAAGLVALSGCRSEPGVAAYVGDHKISEERVTGILDELRLAPAMQQAVQAAEAQPGAESPMPTRAHMVSLLVLTEACQQYTSAQGLRPQQQVTPEMISQQSGLPADSGYLKVAAEFDTCRSGLPVGALVQPTAEEMAKLVRTAREINPSLAELSDEQLAAQLNGQQLQSKLAERNTLATIVEAADVTMNPRYRPLEFPLLSFEAGKPAVSVLLGEPAPGTVIDPR